MWQKDKAKIVDKWVEDSQGKYFCECPCHGVIIIQRRYYCMGIPKYINGHQWIGKHHTKTTRNKQSLKHQGQIPWNKGVPRTDIEKDNISKGLIGKTKGRSKSKKHREKIGIGNIGKHDHYGAKNPNWKNGISSLNHIIRTHLKSAAWIKIIFDRDNYTCRECGQIGWTLNAHHIKPVHQIIKDNKILTIIDALNCDELWNINNGITLCKACHNKISTRR